MAWIGTTSTPTCQAPRALWQDVAALVRGLQPEVEQDRRGGTRTPIPCLFELTPLDADPRDLAAPPLVVVGKEISERGIGFFHQKPIPYRRALLVIELPGAEPVQLEIDLSWCRCTSLGWYESGGRLLGISSGWVPTSRAG